MWKIELLKLIMKHLWSNQFFVSRLFWRTKSFSNPKIQKNQIESKIKILALNFISLITHPQASFNVHSLQYKIAEHWAFEIEINDPKVNANRINFKDIKFDASLCIWSLKSSKIIFETHIFLRIPKRTQWQQPNFNLEERFGYNITNMDGFWEIWLQKKVLVGRSTPIWLAKFV